MRKTFAVIGAGATALAMSALTSPAAAGDDGNHGRTGPLPGGYKNLVVIYEENHSFDNLLAGWGAVGKDQVGDGQAAQVAQDGTAYGCLLQNDVNLTSPSPLATTCTDAAHGVAASAFGNSPFRIDSYIPASATTCPAEGAFYPNGVLNGQGLPGGCTEDLVHRFYQEQYQINGGQQNRYVTGSDAVGLTMGRYDTTQLPIYTYLHGKGAPNYVIADRFFQAAFGGSFLNHQFLIAARAPLDTSGGALGAKYSVVDANGMVKKYPLYTPTRTDVVDGQLTQKCANPLLNDPVAACGAYAVNTVQPSSPPAAASGAKIPLIDDTAYPNIGDRLSAKGIPWAWFSGGWDDAEAGHPGPIFQYHHQPFNYFAAYAPGQPGRAHLQDETKFFAAAAAGTLPAVSFVKPYGAENEHPGYASEHTGSDHLVDLLKAVMSGPQAKDTLVVVTYDEFGGQADHVSVPKVDAWGPGTRIPAMLISARMQHSGVDSTQYDTTSILATIEQAWGLAPLSPRDAGMNPLTNAIRVGTSGGKGGNG